MLVPHLQEELRGAGTNTSQYRLLSWNASNISESQKTSDCGDKTAFTTVNQLAASAGSVLGLDHIVQNQAKTDRAAPTSTSALLQMLLSSFMLRTFEMFGPRERCWPGAQTTPQHQATDYRPTRSRNFLPRVPPKKTSRVLTQTRTHVGVGGNKQAENIWKPILSLVAFSARSALLIGNESAERGALIANES